MDGLTKETEREGVLVSCFQLIENKEVWWAMVADILSNLVHER